MDGPRLRDIFQNERPVFFKAIRVMTDRENMRNSFRSKEMKETQQVNALKLHGLNPDKKGKRDILG